MPLIYQTRSNTSISNPISLSRIQIAMHDSYDQAMIPTWSRSIVGKVLESSKASSEYIYRIQVQNIGTVQRDQAMRVMMVYLI